MRRAEWLLIVMLLAATAPASGASGARLDVAADHGDVDLKAGRARYWGNVVITHDNTRIEAEEVLLQMADGELTTATIRGTPARFVQAATTEVGATEGSARVMTFHTADGMVELREGARIRQDGDEVAGELIRYDVRNERVVAAGGDGQNQGRVQMTITPRKAKEPPPTPAPPP